MKKYFDKIVGSPKIFWPVLAVIFVVCRVAVWFYPYDSDHWIFYYIGRNFWQGGLLYVNAWDHKPPLIFVINGLMHGLFGDSLVWHRILLTVLAIIDIYLFYLVEKILFKELKIQNNQRWAKIGLILYVFWRNLSQFASSGNNNENFGLIFLLGMFLSYFKYRQKNNSWYLLAAGINLSILFFLKENFGLLALPLLIDLIVIFKNDWKRLIGGLVVLALPVVGQLIFWLEYFAKRGALHDFYVAAVLFSSKYTKSMWEGKVSSRQVFVLMLLPLFVSLVFYIYKLWKDYRAMKQNWAYIFIFYSLVASLIVGFALGSFYPYYFLILLPAFVLTAVYGIEKYSRMGKGKWVAGLLIVGMAVSWMISMKQFYNYFRGSVKVQANQMQEAADYVKTNSSPNDKIIYYDYGASFYILADRQAASRFVSASVLLEDYRDNYGFNLDGTFINDLKKNKPKFIVVGNEKNNIYLKNWPVALYFFDNFKLLKHLDGFDIYSSRNER